MSWIKILYQNTASQFLINGILSKSFSIQSGACQGCPLSQALFICAMEPVVQRLRWVVVIKGVPVLLGGQQVKAALYTDDINVVVRNGLSLE